METARALYAPLKSAKTGATIFPSLLLPGSEPNWATLAGPDPISTAFEAFQYVVFKDPAYDVHRFDVDVDLPAAMKMDAGVLNSGETNLKPFFDRGGKLLMYHGWADPQVPAMNTVEYFDAVVKRSGKAAVGKSVALYMVPGMAHCAGGPGTDVFDKMGAIEQWVSRGAAPSQITGRASDRRRRRPHAAALPVRPRRPLQGHGLHRSGRQLRVRGAEAVASGFSRTSA